MKHLQKVLGLVLTIVLLSLAVPFSVSAVAPEKTPLRYFHFESVGNKNPQIRFHLDPAKFSPAKVYTWTLYSKITNKKVFTGHDSSESILKGSFFRNGKAIKYYTLIDANQWTKYENDFQLIEGNDPANTYLRFALWYADCTWEVGGLVIKEKDSGKIVYDMADDDALKNALSIQHGGKQLGNWECVDFDSHPISMQVMPQAGHSFFLNCVDMQNAYFTYTMKQSEYQSGGPFQVSMDVRMDDFASHGREDSRFEINLKGVEKLPFKKDTNGFIHIEKTVQNLKKNMDIVFWNWYADMAVTVGDFTITDAKGHVKYSMSSDAELKKMSNDTPIHNGDQIGNWRFFNFNNKPITYYYKSVPFDLKKEAVYQIGEGEKASYHFNFRSAEKEPLKSGQTIHLNHDIREDHVNLPNGTKLDLNGHTLGIEKGLNVFADSTVYDSAEQKGCLKVAKDKLAMPMYHPALPLWDEAKQGYAFLNVVEQQMAPQPNETHDSFRFKFRPLLDNAALTKAYLSNGGADNGLKLGVRITWLDAQNNPNLKDFFFADEMLQKAYPQNGPQKAFYLRFIGLDLTQYREASVSFVLVSDTGVQITSTPQMCK